MDNDGDKKTNVKIILYTKKICESTNLQLSATTDPPTATLNLPTPIFPLNLVRSNPNLWRDRLTIPKEIVRLLCLSVRVVVWGRVAFWKGSISI